MDRRPSPSRAGFTLIEVLIAILIVALLIAILLPAVNGAFRKAKESQVSAELNNLATALASFKTAYGDYPPSRVILCESGFNSLSGLTGVVPSGGDDMTYQQLIQRSRLYLRKFWPRANFDNDPTQGGTVTPAPAAFNDFDGDGVCKTTAVILNGSECLAFFLGGLPINNGNNTFGTSGFSRLPTNPFINSSIATNRTVPNYEFNVSRLVDQDGDKFPSYVDPLDVAQRRAYAYFTSYGTNSYDPNDDNGNGHAGGNVTPEYEEDGTTVVSRGFTVSFPTSSTRLNPPFSVSPAPNPYTAGPSVLLTGTVAWINPSSFQLFSAGADRNWGLGGQYVQSSLGSTGRLPIESTDAGVINTADVTNGIRHRESDNLTNFSAGRLD